jgi:hypothetical protein
VGDDAVRAESDAVQSLLVTDGGQGHRGGGSEGGGAVHGCGREERAKRGTGGSRRFYGGSVARRRGKGAGGSRVGAAWRVGIGKRMGAPGVAGTARATGCGRSERERGSAARALTGGPEQHNAGRHG